MGYGVAVKKSFLMLPLILLCLAGGVGRLQADEVAMQNGDRYFGKVVSVSSDVVMMDSEMLGKIKVPRKLVASLVFGTNAAAPALNVPVAHVFAFTNSPAATGPSPSSTLAPTNVDLSAAFRQLGANTNFMGQIRDQMLAGSPAASGKYDEMVNGLMNGTMNLNDLRNQAKSSADQIRALKQQLGPDADSSMDAYLQVLDNFVKETDDNSTGKPQPQPQNP